MNAKNQLLSMTEFVLDRTEALGNDDITQIEYIRQTMNAAKFLSQSLEKWMFVPCGPSGNVLQDPGLLPSQALNDYRAAKERCYFDGWQFRYDRGFPPLQWVMNDDFCICLDTLSAEQYLDGGSLGFQLTGNTINDVANVIKGVQLTSAARKFIFD